MERHSAAPGSLTADAGCEKKGAKYSPLKVPRPMSVSLPCTAPLSPDGRTTEGARLIWRLSTITWHCPCWHQVSMPSISPVEEQSIRASSNGSIRPGGWRATSASRSPSRSVENSSCFHPTPGASIATASTTRTTGSASHRARGCRACGSSPARSFYMLWVHSMRSLTSKSSSSAAPAASSGQ